MTCPCCGREMESGFLQSQQRMAWVRRPHRISLLPREGEVLLGNNIINGLTFPAWICKDCQKIVLDYERPRDGGAD